MTGARKRLDALEERTRQHEARAWAYLEGLSEAALNALLVDVLRRDGHEDPEGEAARIRAEVDALTEEDLRAELTRLKRGRS